MNKNILYAFMAGATAVGLASCDENSWNDHYLDGFEGGVDYNYSPKGSYTITADNYSSISSLLQKEATTEAETNAAKAIKANMYFNKASVYPASIGLLPFLNTSAFPYYLGDNGTVVDITFNEATDAPAELASLSAAKSYTVSEDDYKKVWGNSTVYVKTFAPDATAADNLPEILADAFKDDNAVAEGTYVVVRYNNATQNPAFRWDDMPFSVANLYTDATFKAGKYVITDVAAARVAGNLDANKTYGYLPYGDVIVGDNIINDYYESNQVWDFVSTGVDGEYYLQDVLGRYYYQSGTFNSFNVKSDLPADTKGYVWTVTSQGNNTWKITNKEVNKWIQLDLQYNSWGSYSSAKGNNISLYVPGDKLPEPTGDVTYTPASTVENAVYYFDGSKWDVATGVIALSPADYTAMGASNNNLTDPGIYLPIYLKSKLPYAQNGAQQYVIYNWNKDEDTYMSDLFVYDGSEWSLNNIGLEEVVGRFEKKDGEWQFVKYIGKAIFDMFEEQTIELERSYLIVADGVCAMPIKKGSTYGYPEVTKVSISGNQIVEPSDANAFLFTKTYESDGKIYTAPEGKFLIVDTNKRYQFMGGPTRQNVNVSDKPVITDGEIDATYLWEATPNGDGTWSITNRSDDKVRTWRYSVSHTSYGVYNDGSSDRLLPSLYIMAE